MVLVSTTYYTFDCSVSFGAVSGCGDGGLRRWVFQGDGGGGRGLRAVEAGEWDASGR